jgi:hypothetical protein
MESAIERFLPEGSPPQKLKGFFNFYKPSQPALIAPMRWLAEDSSMDVSLIPTVAQLGQLTQAVGLYTTQGQQSLTQDERKAQRRQIQQKQDIDKRYQKTMESTGATCSVFIA